MTLPPDPSPPEPAVEIRVLDADAVRARLGELAEITADCVVGGASIGFMLPFSAASARPFWQGVADAVERGDRVCLAALVDGVAMGTVQLHLALPPNQPHRADVMKLQVHRAARGRGLAGRLMRRLETEAALHGRSLLVLDTVVGGDADRLYVRLGWHRAGVIPGYALWPAGGECDTQFYWKRV